ncbi:MAG TPA: hypothetical protein VM186_13785, partial [Planctomycetota bacterium]|nr:hypothetical protein [Planctomycetota bacterium]
MDHALTAAISGFRKNWDTPVAQGGEGAAGTLVFDAVNRSLLVRFPEAAKMIIDRLNAGWKIDKAELVLDWSGYEMRPADYARTSGQRWRERPPRWHALAWALRRPWMPDAALGPTFNAYVNGLGYWSKYGAQDTQRDCYPAQLGPAELSEVQREGRIDITAVLTDATYGQSVADRLRLPAEQGFLVRKWEVYDARYNFGGYDVDSMTGQCGIMVARPRLVVTFSKAEGEQRYAPPKPRDFAQLVAELRAKPDGKPTAVVMSEAEFARVSEEFRFKQPDWMPDWQWQRVQELYALGGRVFEIPDTYTEYLEWVDRIIASPPRRWTGWDIVDNLTDVLHYRDLLPAPALDAVKLDWWAWTYPDRDWRELEHNQSIDLFHGGRQAYYEQTGDWRGNSSFFRESYTRYMATMNMNHTGVAGALLGGALLGSEHAVADGRFGLEYYPLRLWAWYDGTMQEALDHYYLALTLGGEKSFVDCGPTSYDRLLGKSTLRKSMEELVSAWHPGLRHFIAMSTRTGIGYTQVIQEGTAHIIHTMSRKGALHDVNNPDRWGMPVSGSDLPARRVALKTLTGAWAPEWMANIVDDKPLPYEVTAAFRYWGYYYDAPLWKRSYLGNHYGVASLDIAHEESVPVLVQWKRVDRPLETVQDLGTLL